MKALTRTTSLCLLLALSGCESTGEMGAVIGGVIDGTMRGVSDALGDTAVDAAGDMMGEAGDMMCGSSGSTMCRRMTTTVLAGFSEDFIRQMSARDMNMIADARTRSLRSGETEEWENPETGARGSVASTQVEPQPAQPTVVKVQRDTVEAMPVLDAVGEEYIVNASGGVNMRSGPGTRYDVVNKAGGGSKLMAIAKVQDENWYLMGQGDVATGYVFGDLVGPAPALAEELPTPPPPEPAQVEEVTATVAAECYSTTQTVTLANGDTEEATVTSCRTPNGWAQV